MNRLFRDTGIIIDPHTAVGLAAAQREQARTSGPMVVLGTAHPAKFPDAVKRAIGREPEVPAALQRCFKAGNVSDPAEFGRGRRVLYRRAFDPCRWHHEFL